MTVAVIILWLVRVAVIAWEVWQEWDDGGDWH